MPSSGVLSRGFQQAGLLPRNSLFRSKTPQAGLVNTFLGLAITVAVELICPLMPTFGFSRNLEPHSGESPRRCLPLARNRRRGSRARLHRPALAAHYLALSPFLMDECQLDASRPSGNSTLC